MHAFSFGMEEEFFVFDARTRRAVRRMNKRFHASAKKALGDRVSREMLQSQIEAVTPPCGSMPHARDYLAHYRRTIAGLAKEHGLGIAAMATFPLAFWPEMTATQKPRYDAIMDDLQMIGFRNMLCGMHVHVAVPDVSARINLIMRLTPYLPLLLALSSSSPFWQGHFTGLHAYRLAAYDELPRTGLPELFRTEMDYDDYIAALSSAGVIPDASYIWWAMRPSLKFPTIELRVADSCTHLDDAVAIAALFRCLVRALDRDRNRNAGFDRVARAITAENKWRAQRYGIGARFVEPMERHALTIGEWLEAVVAVVAPDIEALHCESQIERLRAIVRDGASADRQIAAYQAALAAGKRRLTALKDVVDWAAKETAAV
ncbi:MAG: carboxylate-amine ligase [Pseudolabrys sp.]